MRDRQLELMPELTRLVLAEHDRQIKKWGIQQRSPFEWMAYLTEEVGELAQAISEVYYRDGKVSNVVAEAIQVGTLALKIAEMYHAMLPPVE